VSACKREIDELKTQLKEIHAEKDGEVPQVGEHLFMLNPIYEDGTRLKSAPDKEAAFTSAFVLNDAEVEVLELGPDGFVCVRNEEEDGIVEGWVRSRNLTHVARETGLKKANESRMTTRMQLQRSKTISNLEKSHEDADGNEEEENPEKVAGRSMKKLMGSERHSAAGQPPSPERIAEISRQTDAIRAQLRRTRRGTLDPQSKFMARWDAATTMALLFTASVTPFEICVVEPVTLTEMLTDPLSWINRFVDFIFICDVFVQCITCYQESPDKGGSWVHDRGKIIRRYATSWMSIDILTTIPVDVIVAAYEAQMGVDEESGGGGGGASTRFLRVVRMLRLLKLARMLRGSRIVHRWQSYFGTSYAVLSLWQFLLLTAFTAHWMACMWVMVGKVNDIDEDTVILDSSHAFSTSWIHKAGLTTATPVEIYGVSIYCAFSLIFGCGPGPSSPTTPVEYYVQMVVMVIGAFVWAYVISSGCGIIATLNPERVRFRNMMDELNFFARDKKLPRPVTVKLREFLSQTAHVHRQSQYNVLLDSMSARLKADAALVWAKATLLKVPYFNSGPIEDEFLASCALTLKSKVFCRTEYIPPESLCVIERGIAAKDGRITTKGGCIGIDMVLNSVTFRDMNPAIALTFVVQVASLEKKDLEGLLSHYPLARREVRKGSFRLAFCRAVVQVAKVITEGRQMGFETSIREAFVDIRKSKQRAIAMELRLKEPTRKLLASNLLDLSERTEVIAKQSEGSREGLARQMRTLQHRVDGQIAAVNAKLDTVLIHLQGGGGGVGGHLPLSPLNGGAPPQNGVNGSAGKHHHHHHSSSGRHHHSSSAPSAALNGTPTPARSGSSHTVVDAADSEANGRAERQELRQDHSQPLKVKAPSLRQKARRHTAASAIVNGMTPAPALGVEALPRLASAPVAPAARLAELAESAPARSGSVSFSADVSNGGGRGAGGGGRAGGGRGGMLEC